MVVGLAARSGAVVGICCVLAAGCSGDDGGATATAPSATVASSSTAPPRPTTTTSLVYDPATVEGQVEAAYLRSWEVYAAAVYDLVLDEEALASVFADPQLTVARDEIADRISGGRASHFRVEHDYEVTIIRPDQAVLLDRQVNHQVLIDPSTKAPIEADPNETFTLAVVLTNGGEWRVSRVDEVR